MNLASVGPVLQRICPAPVRQIIGIKYKLIKKE